jgi:hypothetical protein
MSDPKDLIDVLLKDYELQRAAIQSYWTLEATITTFILTAVGATASLAKSEERRSWLYWLIPPMMIAVSGLTLLLLRENYYANVYLACIEQQINALASVSVQTLDEGDKALKFAAAGPDLLTWFSKISASASNVRWGAAASSSIIFIGVLVGWRHFFKYIIKVQGDRGLARDLAFTLCALSIATFFLLYETNQATVKAQVRAAKRQCEVSTY